jgi:hypothetical protein
MPRDGHAIKTMTIPQILEQVRLVLPTYGVATFHRDRKRLKAKPTNYGRPTQYPADIVATILQSRGYSPTTPQVRMLPPADTAAARLKMPTLAELRRMKPAKRKARR